MKKILVIDDEELLIKSTGKLLEKQGYDVYTAKNAGDAETLADEVKFDLIIADIRIPGKNGVEVVRTINKNSMAQTGKEVPVIFITGFADDDTESEAMKLNPLAYIMKPFQIKDLIAAVKGAF